VKEREAGAERDSASDRETIWVTRTCWRRTVSSGRENTRAQILERERRQAHRHLRENTHTETLEWTHAQILQREHTRTDT
jgi:hypothetical protein